MRVIKNDSDFRVGYEILGILTAADRKVDDPAALEKHIVAMKRALRLYAHRETSYDRRIIKDGGIDGFVSLERLPDDIRDLAEANRFFEDFMVLRCTPSLYDCTGQAFTNWYKVFRRNGGYYAYHSVSFDV